MNSCRVLPIEREPELLATLNDSFTNYASQIHSPSRVLCPDGISGLYLGLGGNDGSRLRCQACWRCLRSSAEKGASGLRSAAAGEALVDESIAWLIMQEEMASGNRRRSTSQRNVPSSLRATANTNMDMDDYVHPGPIDSSLLTLQSVHRTEAIWRNQDVALLTGLPIDREPVSGLACTNEHHGLERKKRVDWRVHLQQYVALWSTRYERLIYGDPGEDGEDDEAIDIPSAEYVYWYSRITRRLIQPKLEEEDTQYYRPTAHELPSNIRTLLICAHRKLQKDSIVLQTRDLFSIAFFIP
ncbi:hypothetical protein QQ045_011062 [Rhodiola kirilowii]